jgi:hypothetical protein
MMWQLLCLLVLLVRKLQPKLRWVEMIVIALEAVAEASLLDEIS